MFLEYLGTKKDGVLTVSLTMFIGPFSSENDRAAFVEKCRKSIPSKQGEVEFAYHDELPTEDNPDPGTFEIDRDGNRVSPRSFQWAATPPEEFLKTLKEAL